MYTKPRRGVLSCEAMIRDCIIHLPQISLFKDFYIKGNEIMYIFLAIDGVLNTESDWKAPYTLNPACLDAFAETFKNIHPKIILISSWSAGFISKNNPSNTPQIQKLEKELHKRGLEISGRIPVFLKNRDAAVQQYRKTLPERGETLLVIDDDINEYTQKYPELYLTNYKTGFTLKDKKQIQKLFI